MLAHQLLGGEAPARQRAPGEVLGQHVDVGQEAAHERAALGVPQVERDALLVAVEREEGDRHAGRGRVAVAALVAAARRLDLDHLGTQVGEDRGAERPRQEAGQVEDADADERAHR